MTTQRKAGLTAILTAAVVALGALLFQAAGPGRPAPEEPGLPDVALRSVYPVGTATPGGHRAGIVLVRNQFSRGGGVTLTPAPGVVGSHIEVYWEDVQPDLTATPDWRPVETAVAYADALGYAVWLSLQYFENDYGGPDDMYLPSGAPTVAYKVHDFQALTPTPGTPTRTPVATEFAPNYGAAALRNGYATAVASMMDKFGADPRVGGFALQIGASGETMNVQADTRAYKKYWFEQVVPCSAFTNFVLDAAGWYRAGTNKPLTLAMGIAACWESAFNADFKSNRYFLGKMNGAGGQTPTATPLYIAYRHNGGNPDSSQAMYGTPTPGPWGRYQPGYAFPDQGGIGFEPGNPYGFPTQAPTAEVEGYADYMLLNMASANADWIFLQDEWLPYIDPDVYDVITQTLGTTAADAPLAWLWFREAEHKSNVNGLGYTYSGVAGPFARLARIVGSATPTTYCAPSVRATALALGGSAPPDACSQELSVPARESRNALGYNSGAVIGIDVDAGWQHAGDNTNREYVARLRYLDNNSGTLTVRWKFASGAGAAHTITKTGSGEWRTEEWPLTAVLNNGYGGAYDVEIAVSDAQAILNSFVLSYAGETTWDDGTATPSPTASATATGTPTLTPRPTATFVTSTPTRTPTATPDWPTVNCPALAVTLDGQLTEWGGVTPISLNSVTAALIQPATPVGTPRPTGTPPPQSADASGTFYCAVSPDGDTLYLAGMVLDEAVGRDVSYSSTGSLAVGDAVRITLDGRRDGLTTPGEPDDHDLFISPGGRVLDFDLRAVDGVAAAGALPGAWTFEMALDAGLLDVASLTGARFGVTWHLLDADSAAGLEWALSDRKRMGTGP